MNLLGSTRRHHLGTPPNQSEGVASEAFDHRPSSWLGPLPSPNLRLLRSEMPNTPLLPSDYRRCRVNMNLRSARVFVAAAEELSFSRAAERLSISAPHVSETIKKLEREVGQLLFDRTPRSVQLTGAAEALLPSARALLSAHGELQDRIGRLRGQDHLMFGLFYGFASLFVRQLVDQLGSTADPISCDVSVYDWSDPTCGLRSGESDVAVLIGPTAVDDALTRIPVSVQRRMALVADETDVVPDSDGTISLDDVDRVGWIPVVAHDQVWDAAWRLDEMRGGPPTLNGLVQNRIEGMIEAIRAGIGVTVTMEAFSDVYAPDGIRSYPVRGVPPLPVDLAFRGPPTAARFAPIVAAVRQLRPPANHDDRWRP